MLPCSHKTAQHDELENLKSASIAALVTDAGANRTQTSILRLSVGTSVLSAALWGALYLEGCKGHLEVAVWPSRNV